MSRSDLNPSNDLSIFDYLSPGDLQLDPSMIWSSYIDPNSDENNVSALSVNNAQSLQAHGPPDDNQENLSGGIIRDHHGPILLSDNNQLNSLSSMPTGSNKRDQHGANEQQLLPNDNQLNSMSSGSKKRGRELVSDDSSRAKGKGKMKQSRSRRTIVNGESSSSGKKTARASKAVSYEEHIKEKSVGQCAKILTDRVFKRTESVMALLGELFLTYDQIKMPWTARAKILIADLKAMRAALRRSNRYIMRILVNHKKRRLTEDVAKMRLVGANNRLDGFLQKLQNAREELKQISNDLEKARNLDAVFINNMAYSPEDLREELASGMPFDIEELDQN
ncbi:uncharacterized protein LOC120183519 [Hibiscus syriacus]|uniref:uncharacterized protein LOC120183519 n=1 Tax=Hibiscus syriacus TaxID=106335 RepID=UPI001923FA4F|nr:uncharacterized protein LOC120183519 [Hibiscus syriacus]